MSTDKRAITFYADPDVERWYEGLSGNVRSRAVNEIVRRGLNAKNDNEFLVERVQDLERQTDYLTKQVDLLLAISKNQMKTNDNYEETFDLILALIRAQSDENKDRSDMLQSILTANYNPSSVGPIANSLLNAGLITRHAAKSIGLNAHEQSAAVREWKHMLDGITKEEFK